MSRIISSIHKLKNRILSAKNPILLTRTLTSNLGIFSDPPFSQAKIHNLNFNSSRRDGARTLCSLPTEFYQSSTSVSTHNLKRKDLWTSIPVRAYFLPQRIDLIGLMSENQANLIPYAPGMSNYVVLRFPNTNSSNPLRNVEANSSGSGYSYMVVYPYGSAVMFNMLDHEVDRYLKIIKRHASGLEAETGKDGGDSLQNYIDYEVREKQDLPTWMQGGLNCMLLQHLNIDGISIVSNVLSQSVALDYYSRLVDQWVKAYSGINYGLEKKGNLGSWSKLLKLTRSRVTDADIIYNFGLSERSDIARKEDTKYAQMLDYLRDKFELTQRFADLERQFKMGELNIQFGALQMVELWQHAELCGYLSLFVLVAFLPIGVNYFIHMIP
ncbi:hypothetical protein MKW94_021981 [Papaver nudicaule]|uniref:DUF155 domain-containing protein n=1 Tax=Papaver nudicaule TaxID=74823 RepID=A0AA41W2M7_PAPNU|nr:hypothetical protein [Papaver nudicaule]